MPITYGSYWRRLSRMQKTFLVLVGIYIVLYFSHLAPTLQTIVGIVAVVPGFISAFQLASTGIRKAIWRLRNRLLVSYLFIAVVPLILVLTLVVIAGYVVIGQMAVYLVNKELESREVQLQRAAMALARFPASNPDIATNRTAELIRHNFPQFDLLIAGDREIRFPNG